MCIKAAFPKLGIAAKKSVAKFCQVYIFPHAEGLKTWPVQLALANKKSPWPGA